MKIAIVAGSNRAGAASTHAAAYMKTKLELQGISVDLIDLHLMPIPFYSPDEWEMTDTNLQRMKNAVGNADAVILSTPEYHGSISGVLKNALDHMSSEQFACKPVLSVSASGGPVGSASLTQLQAIVRNLHGINCPEWVSVGGDQKRFSADGTPGHPATRDRIDRALANLVDMARRLMKGA